MAKSKTPPVGDFFLPTKRYRAWVSTTLTTRDRELVSEVRIEPGDSKPRPLTLQSITEQVHFRIVNSTVCAELLFARNTQTHTP